VSCTRPGPRAAPSIRPSRPGCCRLPAARARRQSRAWRQRQRRRRLRRGGQGPLASAWQEPMVTVADGTNGATKTHEELLEGRVRTRGGLGLLVPAISQQLVGHGWAAMGEWAVAARAVTSRSTVYSRPSSTATRPLTDFTRQSSPRVEEAGQGCAAAPSKSSERPVVGHLAGHGYGTAGVRTQPALWWPWEMSLLPTRQLPEPLPGDAPASPAGIRVVVTHRCHGAGGYCGPACGRRSG